VNDEAEFRLKHGAEFPYDANDAWWDSGTAPLAAVDWAHEAARGVIADLQDRGGIKRAPQEIDEETRVEIVLALADIIRSAAEKKETANGQA